jgi:uncharacterized protein (DUF983 family)
MTAAQAIIHQRCPRCRAGHIFYKPLWRGPLSMNQRCPVCDLKFEREAGYFLGAMVLSYLLSIGPVLLLALICWRLLGLSYYAALLAAAIVYVPCVPLAARMARVLWIYLDQTMDPE